MFIGNNCTVDAAVDLLNALIADYRACIGSQITFNLAGCQENVRTKIGRNTFGKIICCKTERQNMAAFRPTFADAANFWRNGVLEQ
jgi:hypothetical protein